MTLYPALHLPFFTPPRKARGWIESLTQKAQHQLPFFPLTSQAKQPHTKLLPHTGTENLSLYYNLSCSSFSFFFFFKRWNEWSSQRKFLPRLKRTGVFSLFLFFLFCSCCIDHFYISTLSLHSPFFNDSSSWVPIWEILPWEKNIFFGGGHRLDQFFFFFLVLFIINYNSLPSLWVSKISKAS